MPEGFVRALRVSRGRDYVCTLLVSVYRVFITFRKSVLNNSNQLKLICELC